MLTIRQLWEDFHATAVIHGKETAAEIALQQYGFLCGAIAALGAISAGVRVEPGDYQALIDEASDNLHMEADRDRTAPAWN